MRKSACLLLCLAALSLSACRDTLCAPLARTYSQVDQKARPCLERAPLPAFNEAHCESRFEACDVEDQARLRAQLDCYARLGTCVPGQEDAFLEEITRCDDLAPSNTCEAAFF